MPLTKNDEILFATLRERLRHEYDTALAALNRFEDVLRAGSLGAAGANLPDSLIGTLAGTLSAREVVLLSIVDTWMDVQKIVRSTGLTEKQVRGVLYAKPLTKVIKRDRISGSGSIRFQISAADFSRQFRDTVSKRGNNPAPVRDGIGHGLART